MRLHQSYQQWLSGLRTLGLFAVLWFSALSSMAQVSVQAIPDREQILIGEQVQLQITLDVPAGETVNWPTIGDTLVRNLEVVEQGLIDTNSVDNRTVYQQMLKLTSFDTGYYAVPPIAFQVGNGTAETQPFLVEVKMMRVDSVNQIADIKQPLSVNVSYWEIFKEWLDRNWPYVATGVAVLVAIIVLLVYVLNRKKTGAPIIPQKPPKPAHISALEQLKTLDAQQLWQQGEIKKYYSELTEILREYLEKRYNIYALELTTDEILSNLKHTELPIDAESKLKSLLQLSDLVKFAKAKPEASNNDRSMRTALEFIQVTKQIETPEQPTANQPATEAKS